jgi:putative transposon-encoded protein
VHQGPGADQPHLQERGLGYSTITVERPLRDEAGNVVLGAKGRGKEQALPDAELRDTENVPLNEDVETYFKREVLPHGSDAWIDDDKTKVGYEIPFNRHFYVFKPPRPLSEIDADLKAATGRSAPAAMGVSPTCRRTREDPRALTADVYALRPSNDDTARAAVEKMADGLRQVVVERIRLL